MTTQVTPRRLAGTLDGVLARVRFSVCETNRELHTNPTNLNSVHKTIDDYDIYNTTKLVEAEPLKFEAGNRLVNV